MLNCLSSNYIKTVKFMFYGDSIQDTRSLFFKSWEKYRQKMPLQPLENQIVEVIQAHPEYHIIFDNPDKYLDKSYDPESGETNPYLHLGFHLAVREQIATNRPLGIQRIYQQLLKKIGNSLLVEHHLMEHLAACLWEAQSTGKMPDEQTYLKKLL